MQWARSTGGLEDINEPCLAIDGSCDIVITGHFIGTASFGNITISTDDPVLPENYPHYDIFLAKYNMSGDILWAKAIGGDYTDYAGGVAIDIDDNIILWERRCTEISENYFVTKYGSSGDPIWSVKNDEFAYGGEVATDKSGNIYTTVGAIYIKKYDRQGTLLWSKKADVASTNFNVALDVTTDGLGNVFLTGRFHTPATFGTTTLTSAGDWDIFVTMLKEFNTIMGAPVQVTPISDVTITFAEISQEGYTSVAIIDEAPPPPEGFALGDPPIFYDIQTDAQYTSPITISITYDETQFSGPEDQIKLLHYDNGNWVDITTSLDISQNIITGEVSHLSLFTIAGYNGLIAVELYSFNAEVSERQVILKWNTATETENMGFQIYRSQIKDGEFEKITEKIIPGAGTSGEAHTYSYTDQDVQSGKTYYYKLADVDFAGNMKFHGPISVTMEAIPTSYSLEQNYPNPFNPETNIEYQLPKSCHVLIKIYNTVGQEIKTLIDEKREAGFYQISWDGKDNSGKKVGTGIYIYQLKAEEFVAVKKMVMIQ